MALPFACASETAVTGKAPLVSGGVAVVFAREIVAVGSVSAGAVAGVDALGKLVDVAVAVENSGIAV